MNALERSSAAVMTAVLTAIGPIVATAQQRNPIAVTRVYTGPDNQSHAEQLVITTTAVAGSQSQWSAAAERINVKTLLFRRLSPGFVNDWHPAAGHAYIATISGRGEVEIAGGQRVPLDPTHVVKFDDVTGKGHLTRTVGNEDWVQMVVETE